MLNGFEMTHSMYYNKTPKRSSECDDLDHMPSSKRMKTRNHLDSETVCTSHNNAAPYPDNSVFLNSHKLHMQQPYAQVPPLGYQNDICIAQNNMAYVPPEECSVSHSDLKYLPYLSAAENPHYYENNKLLFELYVERIQRAPSASISVSSSQQQSF